LALAALLAMAFVGCESGTPRSSAPRRPAVDTDERCDNSKRQSCKQNKGSKGGDKGSAGDEDDEGGNSGDGQRPKAEPPLAAYMVTTAEIDTLLPIVQAYMPVDLAPEPVTSAAEFESARTYIEKALNGIMSLKPLAPGRKIKAFVASDPVVNAYADPWQQVVVNSGLLQKSSSAAAVMFVLCHELAHSAHNHSYYLLEGFTTGQSGELYTRYKTAVEDYLRQTFDPQTGIYVHDAAQYARVKPIFDDYAAWKSPLDLTQEAEADAIGALICATAGMTPEEFAAGLDAFFDASKESGKDEQADAQDVVTDPKDLADGDSLEIPSAQILEQFLFQARTHPSDSERLQQAQQLTKKVAKFHDGSATQYKAWRDGYEAVKRSFASFSLAEPRVIVSKRGAVIRIPPRGCSTPRHRH
jgi:Zn-dependent protease with chaperone function